jgi:hypothetical protein
MYDNRLQTGIDALEDESPQNLGGFKYNGKIEIRRKGASRLLWRNFIDFCDNNEIEFCSLSNFVLDELKTKGSVDVGNDTFSFKNPFKTFKNIPLKLFENIVIHYIENIM